MLAVAVIRGLRDDTRHHEVRFAIRGKKTSFTEAIDLIKLHTAASGTRTLSMSERTALASPALLLIN